MEKLTYKLLANVFYHNPLTYEINDFLKNLIKEYQKNKISNIDFFKDIYLQINVLCKHLFPSELLSKVEDNVNDSYYDDINFSKVFYNKPFYEVEEALKVFFMVFKNEPQSNIDLRLYRDSYKILNEYKKLLLNKYMIQKKVMLYKLFINNFELTIEYNKLRILYNSQNAVTTFDLLKDPNINKIDKYIIDTYMFTGGSIELLNMEYTKIQNEIIKKH